MNMLKFMLDKTVTIERAIHTQDAVGGDTVTWAAVASNVKCAIYPKKFQAASEDFRVEDWSGEFEIVFAQDYECQPGDRVKHGTTYYWIESATPFSNLALSDEVVYVVKASLRR